MFRKKNYGTLPDRGDGSPGGGPRTFAVVFTIISRARKYRKRGKRQKGIMTKKKWIQKITLYCQEIGTYQEPFDSIIETLAKILEKRDKIEIKYNKTGKEPVIEYTNKNGSTNMVKNPLLVLWNELNRDALSYFRDLGLTPAGLKKINDNIKPTGKTDGTTTAQNLINKAKNQQ